MSTSSDRDKLYSMLNEANEDRKRRNFNAFMDGLESGLVKDLNKAYASGDMERYNKLVSNIKARGIRVLRNSQGIHKVKFNV